MWTGVSMLAYLGGPFRDMVKQFATPLGMTTLSDESWDEIMGHTDPNGGWSNTEHFLFYTSRTNGESILTTSGETGYYQKRVGGKILQHIFSKELWNRDKAWAYLEGLAEKAITATAVKLRFEDMEPVKLVELDDKDLAEAHDRLHRYYAEWLKGEHREEGDWTFGDLLQKHIFVVAELETRGKKCEYDDGLAKKKSLHKGLIPTLKELQSRYEGFIVWDDEVHEAVKITFKGGPKLEEE